MAEKLIIGPFSKGLRNDIEPFYIDNDSFPTLINAYQWRGRIKRKRGTEYLAQLQRYIGKTDAITGNASITIVGTPLTPGASIFVVGSTIFTDPGTASSGSVTLLAYGTGSATLNLTTGVLTITAGPLNTNVIYYPGLPVLGFRDLNITQGAYPTNLAFDTHFSYYVPSSIPSTPYDVGFYKNPATASSLPSYTRKTAWTPTNWNGQNYNQYWSVNYQSAFWVTNGVNVPFNRSTLNMEMPYAPASSISVVSYVDATTIDFTISPCPLVVGDYVFVNEFRTNPVTTNPTTLNFQTGYVINVAGSVYTVKFPNATIASATYLPGIIQYLTTRADNPKDCLRWYDGDPTGGNPNTPYSGWSTNGWVNFCPPLSLSNFSVDDEPAKQWYLIGSKLIFPFKDRLLFIGPVIQSSAGGDQTYLPEAIVYSQNGTPYYTASFAISAGQSPTQANITFNPILVPDGETATPCAYFEDQSGFGGFVSSGINQSINTVGPNEDVLLLGLDGIQTRLIYTGNDVLPFNFYLVNSELGSSSSFSTIVMDQGIMTRGSRGFILTSQTGAQRFDLPIPDEVFEIALNNNGAERICSQRDFIHEWVYFTYNPNSNSYTYPNRTLQYNYRDDSWAMFNESYTTYGQFRPSSGFTWLNPPAPTWNEWTTPWIAGSTTVLQPVIVGGNQQGILLIKSVDETSEGVSLNISNIVGSVITCINHQLNNGDFIIIDNCQGTVGQYVNGFVFQINNSTTNSFSINISIPGSPSYTGGGQITRMYIPNIRTKQFPFAWSLARKTRIGPSRYLLTATSNAQMTVNLYLSQDETVPYNTNPPNQSVTYSSVIYTCPESTNLGLTAANVNLMTPNSFTQSQIWHRLNTSLIGDTIQFGFTLSNDQMSNYTSALTSYVITGATQANPCVLTCTGQFPSNSLIKISGVEGMLQLNTVNQGVFKVVSSTSTTVTINIDASGFDTYTSGGTATQQFIINQFSEIELHGIIADIFPSQLLV